MNKIYISLFICLMPAFSNGQVLYNLDSAESWNFNYHYDYPALDTLEWDGYFDIQDTLRVGDILFDIFIDTTSKKIYLVPPKEEDIYDHFYNYLPAPCYDEVWEYFEDQLVFIKPKKLTNVS